MLAFLPQYESDVAGVAILVAVVIGILPALVTGRMSALQTWSGRRVRLAATLGVLFASGWAAFDFLVSSEPTGGYPQGHWGDRTDKLMLAGWLVFLAAIVVWSLFRELRFLRRTSRRS